jgi:hypothetical protein
MILHVASIAAIFVDQATQPECLVKCVSDAGHDPIWARLFFEAVPSIFALGIAALVFYWNGGREHKQWIRDQKKAEWSLLLQCVTEIQRALDLGITTPQEQIPSICENLKPAIRRLSEAFSRCLFIESMTIDVDKRKRFFKFLENAELGHRNLCSSRAYRNASSDDAEKNRELKKMTEESKKLTEDFWDFSQWLYQEAKEDLLVASSSRSSPS